MTSSTLSRSESTTVEASGSRTRRSSSGASATSDRTAILSVSLRRRDGNVRGTICLLSVNPSVWGTAFLAGSAIAANAGSLGRADASESATIANRPSSSTPLGSGQPPRRELAALLPLNATPAPKSVALPQVTVFGFRIASRPYSRSGVCAPVSALLRR